jgi:hypothetical protein
MQFLAIGLGAGILAGLFGIGGGLVIVPALMLLGKMTPHRATGTSLAALLLPVGLLGALEYWKSGNVDARAAAWVALGLLAGAWVGANLALKLSGRGLQRGFAVFLVLVAAEMWWRAGR